MNDDTPDRELNPVPDYQRDAIERAIAILKEHFSAWVVAVDTAEEDIEVITAFDGPLIQTRGLAEMLRDAVKTSPRSRPVDEE
jgi:hypothetical protein